MFQINEEDGTGEDPEALLNAWLGELDNLTMVSVITIHFVLAGQD